MFSFCFGMSLRILEVGFAVATGFVADFDFEND